MTTKEASAIIEAILFASGDPVPVDRLCVALEMDKAMVELLIGDLADSYNQDKKGIVILKLENSVQMASRADYGEYVRKALEIRKKPSLSATALEVLAIIAYRQPVTRQYIEQIRGVDSSYTVGMLVEKGLIYESGRLEVPGRPILYKTTHDFLRCFGLNSINELPEVKKFEKTEGEQLSITGEPDLPENE